MSFIPALISAGSSLLGGLFGQSSAEKEAERNRRAQLLANQRNIRFQRQTNRQNIAEARRASRVDWERYNQARATNIQTIASDAKAAGIHPLAALGVNMAGVPASPVGTVRAPTVDPVISPSGNVIGDGIARAGAQLADGLASQLDTRSKLENELLSAQIEQTRAGTAQMLMNATSRSGIASVLSNPGAPAERFDNAQRDYGEIQDFVFAPGNLWGDFVREAGARGAVAALNKFVNTGGLTGTVGVGNIGRNIARGIKNARRKSRGN